MTESIQAKTVRGSVILGGSSIVFRLINVVASVYLLRLLDPVDFGIVALASVVLSYTGLFAGLGLGSAVIQAPSDLKRTAYHSFVATAVMGILLSGVIWAAAGSLASLLGNPNVTPVLQWMSAIVLLDSLSRIPESLLQKELLFGRVSTGLIASELVYTGVALLLAYLGFGLWSLVYANLLKLIVKLISYWMMCPGWDWVRPATWDWGLMKRLLRYGMHITGTGFAYFFYSTIDNLLVGKLLGTSALGYYGKAYDFTNNTVGSLSNIISGVLFPSYSRIQEDKERLTNAYLKSLRLIAVVIIPIALGIFVTAPEMITILIGDKWLPMILPLQILSLVYVFMSLSITIATVFQATGHPDLNFRGGAVVSIVIVPLILLFLGQGIAGVACGVLVAHIIGFAYNVYRLNGILPGAPAKMLMAVLPTVMTSLFMLVGVQLSKEPLLHIVGGTHTVLSLLILVLIGIAIICLAMFVTQRPLVSELLAMVRVALKPKTEG